MRFKTFFVAAALMGLVSSSAFATAKPQKCSGACKGTVGGQCVAGADSQTIATCTCAVGNDNCKWSDVDNGYLFPVAPGSGFTLSNGGRTITAAPGYAVKLDRATNTVYIVQAAK